MKTRKKTFLIYYLIFGLVLFSCKKEADFKYDSYAAPNLELKEGLNAINTSPTGDLELNVLVTPGENIKYVVLSNGEEVKSELVKEVQTVNGKKATTCWECGVDKDGNKHCWKVTCPDIVGPWDTTKALSINKLMNYTTM